MNGKSKNTWSIPVLNTMSVVQGYQRQISRKIRGIVIIVLSILLLVFIYKKIFFVYRTKEDLTMEKMCLEFINRSVDKCLQYRTRHDQNKAFAAIKTHLPLIPLKMTRANAVFLYTHKKPYIVIKRCIVSSSSDLAEDEVSMSLNNENIVKFYKAFRSKYINYEGQEETIIWLFMEYMGSRISQDAIRGNEDRIREVATAILRGLKYLHSIGIAHLDLKISNVMGKETKEGIVYKIIDFGFSRRFRQAVEYSEIQIPSKSFGTYPYKPPETSQLNVHSMKGDIWCLGAIVWFLSLKQTPFYLEDGKKDIEKYRLFIRGRIPLFFRSGVSPALKDFVRKCMAFDRFLRPSASELLEHPFITGSSMKDIQEKEVRVSNEDFFEESSSYATDTGLD